MEGSESSRDTSWEKARGACPPAGFESWGKSSRNTRPSTATCMSETRGRPPAPKDGLHSRSTPTTWPGCRQRGWLERRGERCSPGEAASVGRACPAVHASVAGAPGGHGEQPLTPATLGAGHTPAGACPRAWPAPPRRPGSGCPPWQWAAGSSHPACPLKMPCRSWGGAELQSPWCPPGHPQLAAGPGEPSRPVCARGLRGLLPTPLPSHPGNGQVPRPLRVLSGGYVARLRHPAAGSLLEPEEGQDLPVSAGRSRALRPSAALPTSHCQPPVTFRGLGPKGVSSSWSPSPRAWGMLTSPGA